MEGGKKLYKSHPSITLIFWKLELETEGEAEAEGSFYAQLQKYLEISCKKTRIRDKKWHL